MHLALVRKRTFDFTSFQTSIPVPAAALERSRAAASVPTPPGLSEFPHVLSDWEEAGEAIAPAEGWLLSLSELVGDRTQSVVPLVTEHFACTKVREVFAAWQTLRAGRGAWRLVIEPALVLDGHRASDGLMIGFEPITARRHRNGR